MPKKEELQKLVRGKGLEAFRPSEEENKIAPNLENQARLSVSVSPGETASTVIAEVTTEQPVPKKQLNSHCMIMEIVPGPEQQTYIEEMFGRKNHQILIWDTFVSQGEKIGSVFEKDAPLTFHVCCAVSELLAKLKPRLEIHWMTYDLKRMQVQPLYEFSIRTRPWWPIFKLCYEMQPALAGFYKFHVILDIEQVDFFCLHEGVEFKIR